MRHHSEKVCLLFWLPTMSMISTCSNLYFCITVFLRAICGVQLLVHTVTVQLSYLWSATVCTSTNMIHLYLLSHSYATQWHWSKAMWQYEYTSGLIVCRAHKQTFDIRCGACLGWSVMRGNRHLALTLVIAL